MDDQIKIKEEKADPEVEQKIKEQFSVNVKKEPIEKADTKKSEEGETNSTSSGSNAEEDPEDKKAIELVKSSNELLAELFQVFDAAPPKELLDDENLLKKTHKSKKRKKEKRKKHKKHKSDEDSEIEKSESNDPGIKKEKHKHKKKKKHKNKDDEKERSKSKDKESVAKLSKEHDKSSKIKEDKDAKNVAVTNIKKEIHNDAYKNEAGSRKRRTTDNIKSEQPPAKASKSGGRTQNSFYNGYKESSETKRKEQCDANHLSDISLSDEDTYLRERERIPSNSASIGRRHNDYETTHHRDRRRYDMERSRRRSRERQRKRSPSRDLGIDKKRLLEIARKNAISMFKRGNLPGCANMSEDVKDKVLLQMRYGGRTVQDLTDFCRKISNGEPLSDLSDGDSDVDREGNSKAFHHPFQLKEREPIVLQIRNAKPIIPAAVTAKRDDQAKAILMQFPVSSGQQHRVSESWIPVETKSTALTPLPALPVAAQSTNLFKPSTSTKNVFEKSLPSTELQEPAFKAIGGINGALQDAELPIATNDKNITEASATTNDVVTSSSESAQPVSSQPVFVPDVPIPSSTSTNSIFPETPAAPMDVSNIISKRLSALRRLQENPMDSEAIKMMYNSQKEMSTWASSKHIPGQFTGSTGVNVLKVHELSSGPQVWARRDQLTSTKPVTGGMGMHLLQKMGWKPGEGLGREKTGALQPLLLDVKLDKRGLVAKDDHSEDASRRGAANSKKRPNNSAEALQNFQNKHPVCILNEMTSKRKWTPPLYELIGEGGPSHNKKFLFSVSMNGQTYTPPDGSNTKKEAKMLAAKFCLEQMGVLPSTG